MQINGHVIEPDRLYTAAEWAGIAKISDKTLAKDRCHRTGPAFVKMANRIYYRGRDLIAYIDSCTHPTDADAAVRHAVDKAARAREAA